MVRARGVLRLGRELAEVRAVVMVNTLVPSDAKVCQAMEGAQMQYAQLVKNNSGHNFGPPDFMSGNALMLCYLANTTDAHHKGALNQELNKLQSAPAFQDRVLRANCGPCFDDKTRRIEFAFGNAWRHFDVNGANVDLQCLVVQWLEQIRNARVIVGKAPRNRNQRIISALLDDLRKLGIKDDGEGKH